MCLRRSRGVLSQAGEDLEFGRKMNIHVHETFLLIKQISPRHTTYDTFFINYIINKCIEQLLL